MSILSPYFPFVRMGNGDNLLDMTELTSVFRFTCAVFLLGVAQLGAEDARADRLAAEATWTFNTKG